jgi:sugar (pentulose or hexulose) kinase
MSAPDKLLVIDNGTQSIRAMLFDPAGNLLHRARVPLQAYVSPRPGLAEQEAGTFWKGLCRACSGLWADSGHDPESVAGVSLTTQRATMIPLDDCGAPLRPAVVWLDQRKAARVPPLGPLWSFLFRVLGLSRTVNCFQTRAVDNWMACNEPRLWERTHKFLFLSGYLLYRLTGSFVDSTASQVGYVPFDSRRLNWAKPGDWRWRALQVRPEQLPCLHPPGRQLGEISSLAAEMTGILPGTPVIAAASDKACETLGAGCTRTDMGCLGYGTTATINVTSPEYVEPYRFIPPYPAAIPGSYTLEIQNFRGYWLVSWFRKEFGFREEELAARAGTSPEELLNEMLDQTPPGGLGLIAQPTWTPGVRIPGPEAKGAIIGFGDVHTRAHVYRAIIEGLAFALRQGREQLQHRTGTPIRELVVSGGGSRSDRVMQLTADVFGLPASRPGTAESSGLGAAIDAAVGTGLHPDFPSAVKAMTRTGRTFEPDRSAHELYDRLFRRVYVPMYARLKPLYQEIQRITGYPEP